MRACRDCGIQNVLITMWGDNGKECSFYSLLPSLFAIRQFYEGETRMSVIKEKFFKVTGENFNQMMALDIPNQVNHLKKDNNTLSKTLLYSDTFNGFVDSVVVNTNYCKEYQNCSRRLAKYAKNSQYGYIFDCMSKLCRVLAIKCDLGLRTRTAYKEGDSKQLQELIISYKKTEKQVWEFYQSFKKLWFIENKPHGFDVQDIRFGALINRLRACRERLQDYVNGKIESIPELEEELLDFYGNGREFQTTAPHFIGWSNIVTVNVL
jgi:hypothetical protein